VLGGCTSKNTIEIEIDENQTGWYYILWTTDTLKCPRHLNGKLKFDQNKVVYINEIFFDNYALRIVNRNGSDVSNDMREFLGNEYCMHFYHPDKNEHLGIDDYYPNLTVRRDDRWLKKLGYVLYDTSITPLHKRRNK
jgi:hypothetical protein